MNNELASTRPQLKMNYTTTFRNLTNWHSNSKLLALLSYSLIMNDFRNMQSVMPTDGSLQPLFLLVHSSGRKLVGSDRIKYLHQAAHSGFPLAPA